MSDEKVTKNETEIKEIPISQLPSPEETKETKEIDLKEKIQEGEFSIDDIFITEDDKFNVSVSFYKKDKKLIVETIDDDFSLDHKSIKIDLTFKYPSQGDVSTINHISMQSKVENMDVRDFARLELSRMLCLVRGWNIPKPCNNENVIALSPTIVKAILNKIREVIGTEGMF